MTTARHASAMPLGPRPTTGAHPQPKNPVSLATTLGDNPADSDAGEGNGLRGVVFFLGACRLSQVRKAGTVHNINGDPVHAHQRSEDLPTEGLDDFAPGVAAAGNCIDCLAQGTHIPNPDGDRSVQDLLIGELTLNHQDRTLPVQWGVRHRRSALAARLPGELPARIEAGGRPVAVLGSPRVKFARWLPLTTRHRPAAASAHAEALAA
jgi:hypothetical protein